MSDLKFRGYAIKDEKNWTQFELLDFECVSRLLLAFDGLLCSSKLTRMHQTGRWHGGTTLSTLKCSTAAFVNSSACS